ncbi:MAG: serine O-acetyltransferase [Coriobacteriia bacterium]|nr:serine O-acetyltransferase [Coriobacteriia bacterium]MCL2537720.1 serine O-acetyltransferase [Coriobacteriia bacterium]
MFRTIKESVQTIQANDPAATTVLSALVNYPGLHAMVFHRFNHMLWRNNLKFFARWGSQCTRFLTGIEIHPGATIGRRFFIDHGMGVVIGETTIIGDDCTLYQGVTLGGTGKETGKRHPTLGNGVIVGVGASVLGNITLGDNSKVGGGAVAVKDVPEGATVVGIPGRIVGEKPKPAPHKDEETPADAARARHEHLPDPYKDTIKHLTKRIEDLEAKLGQ